MSALPPLYAAWMEKILPGKIPSENNATCDNCAMCAPEDQTPQSSGFFFDPHVKCCSYLPELYNFLVGGILADE
ncbi:MAG TPA: hypothetical protein VFP10_12480, partial [Candidatus Eisenbacteria bacterium]|nr:hypothetical protein [Candidatus Eisenbacteria bacterium]